MLSTVTDKKFLIGVLVGVVGVFVYTRYVSGMMAPSKDS